MPPQPWKTLSSRPIYTNKWISVREDIAQMPNGKETIYGVVSMQGAVGVLPFVDEEHVLLVRQYRYPHGENFRWEIPTGAMHDDEAPVDAAQRELREEGGYEAAELVEINIHHPSNSATNQTAWIFVARGLTPSPLPPDDTEDLEVGIFPFAQVVEMVKTNEIRDALTVIAILREAVERTDMHGGSHATG
jgi:ADP-ribose pyrophosphatase